MLAAVKDKPFGWPDLRKLGEVEHIAMHHCIQGWSGIAKWGGIPMKTLIELVRPRPEAHTVAFYSFGEAAGPTMTPRASKMCSSRNACWRAR